MDHHPSPITHHPFAPPPLRIRLLGELDLRLGNEPLPPLESARAESLLAYLLLHQDAPQARQHLAFLLWPDSSEGQARTNLRHLLHTLRRALPDPDRFLAVTPRTLQWRTDAPCWLDVAAFQEAAARAGEAPLDDLDALREAAAIYGGDLLPGCYDEWLQDEREALRRVYLATLQRLTTLLEARHAYAEAIAYGERLLRHDPLDEQTYRRLMQLHDARGNRARALRVYHDCAATLERELGVEPSAETREAYEALLPSRHERPLTTRPDARIGGPPLVGRRAEWSRLAALWRTAEGGRAHFVLISGEPGIGKTRLIEELRAWCAHRGAATVAARSYPAEGPLAYGPVVAWLRSDALKGRLARLDDARLALLARLLPELQADVSALAVAGPLSEREQRLQLFEAVSRAMLGVGKPLLLVAEDLHWCDRETLQFLHYLLRSQPDARLLVAATTRREELEPHHPLHDLLTGLHRLECVTEIPLARLTAEETALLAERVAGRPLALPEADRLYDETEGNPLFVVETLRAGWNGAGATHAALPAKVQAVIEARLAQLSAPVQELVGVAATIGREFTPEILAQASGAGEESLVRALDELWRRRMLREHGVQAYDFSHDKIREVAYLALSPATRRHHHAAVARALQLVHAGNEDAVSGQIAAHWERSGQLGQAIAWCQRAAEAAQKRFASIEAARLLEHALALVRTLPETTERATGELAILAALPATLWAEGYGSPRMDDVHRRALEIGGTLGLSLAPPLLRSLAIVSLTRSDFAAAQRFGTQVWEHGQRDGDDVLAVEGAYVLGIAAFWQGQFTAARQHFQTAIGRYRPDYRRAHLLQYGLDPKVICLSRLGNTLWFLGHAAAASDARDEALALADEIGHPYSQQTALVFAALLALDMRDLELVRGYAAQWEAHLGESAAPQAWIAAEAIAGYLDVVAGGTAGLARIQGALDHTREFQHAPGIRACMVRWLLEACIASGECRLGLAIADESLGREAATLWEAETRRLRAEFLTALGAPCQDVEAELARALQVARRQEARALELRVALSLLRLRHRRGDGPAIQSAEKSLRAILAQLPDDHETADLREARSLLD